LKKRTTKEGVIIKSHQERAVSLRPVRKKKNLPVGLGGREKGALKTVRSLRGICMAKVNNLAGRNAQVKDTKGPLKGLGARSGEKTNTHSPLLDVWREGGARMVHLFAWGV